MCSIGVCMHLDFCIYLPMIRPLPSLLYNLFTDMNPNTLASEQYMYVCDRFLYSCVFTNFSDVINIYYLFV